MARLYLDAMPGLFPSAPRAHGAERAIRREHEGLLVAWALASRSLLRWAVIAEGVQATVGFGLAGLANDLRDAGRSGANLGGTLLLAYGALNLPMIGAELALLARQYPLHRSTTLRLLEPLGSPEEDAAGAPEQGEILALTTADRTGVALALESVSVRAAGHTILEDIDLRLERGNHVAIVGPSGAGKSSLVGLLLGWHRASAGQVLVDGEPLDAARLDRLRGETAWVDPEVQLWNRSLLENLQYGVAAEPRVRRWAECSAGRISSEVLRRLPDGLQTSLGDGGGRLSGGEGQRVRLGRAWYQSPARLVILDEPFRGLDHGDRRRCLLCQIRRHFRGRPCSASPTTSARRSGSIGCW